ncbi:MAG: hypothetical protein HYV26_09940 [Candidatus Hydrogenedentes bacterium]|nr:hypothetical protein [Candidatus Hydrogenedentota bacterium]
MNRTFSRKVAHRLLMGALCIFSGVAAGESGPIQHLQDLLDSVERGLSSLGKKAEDLIGPGIGIGEEKPAAYTASRSVDERYPVGPTPTVSVVNEFGTITINTWEERVVQVMARIQVGAETLETAEAAAGLIKVNVSNKQDLVEISSTLPEGSGQAYSTLSVDYTITVPANANVVTDNFFGDSVVRGVAGLVAVQAQYGSVELADLAGTVKVRMHGEFQLLAHGLARGGIFELHGAQAVFSNVAGELEVSNFRGSVVLQDLARESSADIESNSGPVRVVLRPDVQPELTATVLYGEVQSALELARSRQGNRLVARMPNPDSRQIILIAATFGDIAVEQANQQGTPNARAKEGDELISEVTTLEEPTPEGSSLTLDATLGNIAVEGVDGDKVLVKATRLVWVAEAARAPEALRALEVRSQPAGGQMTLSTAALQEMAPLGVSAYSVDLTVSCPRHVPVTVRAQQGATSVTGMAAPVNITQAAGEVRVERCEGEVNVMNQQGNATVTDCAGPVQAVARYGTLNVARILGKITTDTVQGTTIIEAPQGDLLVRNSGGDARILAMDGAGGDYDVLVHSGDIRILLGESLNAQLQVRARNGVVYSASTKPLGGTIQGDLREYSGRFLDGLHKIRLETVDGDIIID